MRVGKVAILLVVIVLTLVGCRPKGIMTSRQMRLVLYDLHRADAILQIEGLTYGHDEEIAKYYQVVLDKHHITQAEFDSSLVWYTDHPQLFNKIYPKVLKRVQAEKAVWDAMESPTQPTKRTLRPIEDIQHEWLHGYKTDLWQAETEQNEPSLGPVYGLGSSKEIQEKNNVEKSEDEGVKEEPSPTETEVTEAKQDTTPYKRTFRNLKLKLNKKINKTPSNP